MILKTGKYVIRIKYEKKYHYYPFMTLTNNDRKYLYFILVTAMLLSLQQESVFKPPRIRGG